MLIQRSGKLLCSGKLSVEEFPVAFQISKQYMCSDNPRVSGWVCLSNRLKNDQFSKVHLR